MKFDPRKLPKYHRNAASREDKERNCANGLHVPVRAYDPTGQVPDEYYCQECCVDMTKEEHEKFFEKARLL